MERVWLATNYYQDPKVVGCPATTERMLTRLIAYCGNAETGGYLPENPHKAVGIPRGKQAVDDLIARGILNVCDTLPAHIRHVSDTETCTKRVESVSETSTKNEWKYYFPSWRNWNSQADDLVKRKKNERERQAKKRKLDATVSRDMSRDVTAPEKRREEKNSKEFSSNAYVSDARDDEKPRGPAVPVDAWKLVRNVIPNQHPTAVRTDLAMRASALLKSGTAEGTVKAALELWLTKPNLGPGVLPSLVSEVIKSASPIRAVPTNGVGPASEKALGWLAIGEKYSNAQRHAELE